MTSEIEEAIQFARSASKAELHLHIEGAITPELILTFSQRNGIEIPYNSLEEIRDAYQFEDLEKFVETYLVAFKTIRCAKDYDELIDDFASHAIEENTVHAEFFTEAQGGRVTGLPLSEIMRGCIDAVERWRDKGLEIRLLPTFLRNFPEDEALQALDDLEPYYEHMTGIGLASVEVGYPPELFRRLFDRARKLGFHLVAHAGEEGPPEYIWGAIDDLGIERIDHGNRALEDPVLMRRLERDQIPLTMCPLSNLRLCVVEDLKDHPLKKFLDAGLKVTINSDDPGYFNGYLNENFEQMIRAQELTVADVRELVKNSHEASFDLPVINS